MSGTVTVAAMLIGLGLLILVVGIVLIRRRENDHEPIEHGDGEAADYMRRNPIDGSDQW